MHVAPPGAVDQLAAFAGEIRFVHLGVDVAGRLKRWSNRVLVEIECRIGKALMLLWTRPNPTRARDQSAWQFYRFPWQILPRQDSGPCCRLHILLQAASQCQSWFEIVAARVSVQILVPGMSADKPQSVCAKAGSILTLVAVPFACQLSEISSEWGEAQTGTFSVQVCQIHLVGAPGMRIRMTSRETI